MTTIEKLKVMLEAPVSTSIIAYRTWIKEILEEQEKYKWHDLRKNPEDLPTDYHQVLVAWSGMKICDIAVYGSDTKLWGTFTASYKTGEVIAWREIEPFEEEEE